VRRVVLEGDPTEKIVEYAAAEKRRLCHRSRTAEPRSVVLGGRVRP
jgi:hypothetical protein